MTQKTRNSNIEWLRIFSMFLILLGHIYATGFDSEAQPTVVWFASTLFGTWSILGVDLFVITSAYFFCEQRFSAKRILSVLFEAVCYIFAFGICHAAFACSAGFSIRLFLGSLFYFFVDHLFVEYHWFVIAYLALCLLFPFLNKLLELLEKRQLLTLLLVLLLVSLFTNIYGSGYYSVFGNVANFCLIYLLTAYFKKNSPSLRLGLLCILLPILFVGSRILTHYLPNNTWGYLLRTLLSTTIANNRRYSLIMVFLALFLFFLVAKKPARSNAFVNAVARCAFGVYLFHETYFTRISTSVLIDGSGATTIVEKDASLKDIVINVLTEHNWLAPNIGLVWKLFVVALAIFLVGVVIEWIRSKLLQGPFIRLITKKYGDCLEKFDAHFHF